MAFCRKLLGDCNFEAPICRVLLCVNLSGSSNLQAVGCVSLLGNYNLQVRFRFIMFLKHAHSLGDSGS